jgi:hypothetical protein
MGVKVELACSE